MIGPLREVPPKTFTPIGENICAHVLKVEETDGGIVIPDRSQDNLYTPVCVVIAVGPEVKWIKEGQKILVPFRTAAGIIRHEGNKYVIMRESDVMGILCEDKKK